MSTPSIAISEFARNQHSPLSGRTYFRGTEEELLELVAAGWNERKPGMGRTDRNKVVVVPVAPEKFVGSTILLEDDLALDARVDRRQPHEDPHISVRAYHHNILLSKGVPPRNAEGTGVSYDFATDRFSDGQLEYYKREPIEIPPAKFAKVVCYHKDALLENDGQRSSDADWEIVALLTSDVDDEPMQPLTMARNYLQKAGGTYAPYTAQQFAESIYYWSLRVQVGVRRS